MQPSDVITGSSLSAKTVAGADAMGAASSLASRRRFPRRRTKGRSRIRFDQTVIDCLIVDRSEGGVGLLLREGDTVPDIFFVEIPTGKSRRVEIVWRGYPRCGAVFRD